MAKGYIESLLGEQEKIILVTKRHWFTLIGTIFVEIVLIVVILVATIVLGIIIQKYLGIFALVGFLILLIPVISMIREILDWSNRQYIITNRRVMQVSGVFNKDVTDSSLEKVNDVKLEQSFWGRIFDYGDIEILTASELGANLFKRIAKPIQFKTSMLNAKERLDRDMSTGFAEQSQSDDIPGLIAQLDNLRKQGVLSEEEFNVKKAELLAKM